MYATLMVTPGSKMSLYGKMSIVMRFLPHKCDFRCFLEGKTIKSESNSSEILRFSSKPRDFRFFTSEIRPRSTIQNQNFGEITPEMKRSRAVRVHNIKFYNISISMKKVRTHQKQIFLSRKKKLFREGNDSAL